MVKNLFFIFWAFVLVGAGGFFERAFSENKNRAYKIGPFLIEDADWSDNIIEIENPDLFTGKIHIGNIYQAFGYTAGTVITGFGGGVLASELFDASGNTSDIIGAISVMGAVVISAPTIGEGAAYLADKTAGAVHRTCKKLFSNKSSI